MPQWTLWGRTSQKSYKWELCSLPQPQALTANPHQSTPSTLYPSELLWAARASFVPRLSWTWSTKPWVLPDGECSPWELGQRDHECAAASAEGAVTLMATPHIRQMARKPPVSPEKASQPPGFLRVGASPGWAALLQWAQSDAWHLLDLEEVSTATTFPALLNDEQPPLPLPPSFPNSSSEWFPPEQPLLLKCTSTHPNPAGTSGDRSHRLLPALALQEPQTPTEPSHAALSTAQATWQDAFEAKSEMRVLLMPNPVSPSCPRALQYSSTWTGTSRHFSFSGSFLKWSAITKCHSGNL